MIKMDKINRIEKNAKNIKEYKKKGPRNRRTCSCKLVLYNIHEVGHFLINSKYKYD